MVRNENENENNDGKEDSLCILFRWVYLNW